jgi:hypothetical protein
MELDLILKKTSRLQIFRVISNIKSFMHVENRFQNRSKCSIKQRKKSSKLEPKDISKNQEPNNIGLELTYLVVMGPYMSGYQLGLRGFLQSLLLGKVGYVLCTWFSLDVSIDRSIFNTLP